MRMRNGGGAAEVDFMSAAVRASADIHWRESDIEITPAHRPVVGRRGSPTEQDGSMTDLDSRTLGQGGPSSPPIGIGGNNFGRIGTATQEQSGTDAVFKEALDLGVTLIDTADVYGNEFGLSETLIETRSTPTVTRSWSRPSSGTAIVAQFCPASQRHHVPASVLPWRGSLQAGCRRTASTCTQHARSWDADRRHHLGARQASSPRARSLAYGHSNFTAEQIDEGSRGGWFVRVGTRTSTTCSLVTSSVTLPPAVVRASLGFLPYFPLANGLFTGRFTRSEWPEDSRIMRQRPHRGERADGTRSSGSSGGRPTAESRCWMRPSGGCSRSHR